MRACPALLCTLALLSAGAPPPRPADGIHVSPGGDDRADGTAERPFRTLERARDAVRAFPAKTPRRIVVRGGTYYGVSLLLGPEDSGLTLEGAEGEEPVLYGGIPLEGWEREDERLWTAKLPPRPGGRWDVRLLEVEGEARPRARWPREGTLEHLSVFPVPWKGSAGGGWERPPTAEELTTLRVRPGDLPSSLALRDAELTIYHLRDASLVGVEAHDAAAHSLRLSPPCGHPPGAFDVRRYVVWNLPEGLTRPGQWRHDRARDRIVYWPLEGEDPARMRAVVPTVPTILRLRGRPGAPVRDVTVRRLVFSSTTVPLEPGGFAAARFEGAVALEHVRDASLEELAVTDVGGHAVKGRACERVRLEDCEIARCGAGGIYLEGSAGVIRNNHVHRIGLSHASAIAIYSEGESNRGNRVCHNEVHDAPGTGIHVGGEANVLEHNYVYDCMKALRDGAAIRLSAARDCVVRRNVARDLPGAGAAAYSLDERSEGCVLEENLSWDVRNPARHDGGRRTVLRNNLFVVRGDARLAFPGSSGGSLERNIVYAFGSVRIEGLDAGTSWSANLIYSGAGRIEGLPPGDTVAGDPLFADLEKMDFEFGAGSPARKLGIRPLDFAGVGREPREGPHE